MSKYTTSIEVIINSHSNAPTIQEKIEQGRKFIFSFSYPYPNEDFKKSFETQFCQKYYTDCIGFETVPLFLLKLNQRLNELMPEINFKYNALQKIINADPLIESIETSNETGNNTSNNQSESVNNLESNVNSNSNNKSKIINSDLPASIINADEINKIDYASNGSFSNNDNKSDTTNNSNYNSSSNNNTITNHTIEKIFERKGNELENYVNYYNAYNNIMTELLNSLDSLFLQLLY